MDQKTQAATVDDSLVLLGVEAAIEARERCDQPLMSLRGYLGTPSGDRVRLYADLGADAWVEMSQDGIVLAEREPGDDDRRVRLHLRAEARVSEHARHDTSARASRYALPFGGVFDHQGFGPVTAIDPLRPIARADCVKDCEGVFGASASDVLRMRQRGQQALQQGRWTQAGMIFDQAQTLENRAVGALADCLTRCRTRPLSPSVADIVNKLVAKYLRPVNGE